MKAASLASAAIILGAIAPSQMSSLGRLARKASKFKNRPLLCQNNGGDPIRVKTQPGRNEKCPCGSQKKYKSCCALRAPIKEIVDVTMAEKVESRLQGDV